MAIGRLRELFFRRPPQPLPIVTPVQSLPKTGGDLAGRQEHDRAPGVGSFQQRAADPGEAQVVSTFVKSIRALHEAGGRPTEQQLIAYAEYLGVDLGEPHGDLMWIVDQSILAPLPAEWSLHQDHNGRVFYHNQLTRSNTWTHPSEPLHKEVYHAIVRFRGSGLSPRDQKKELARRRQTLEELERETQQEEQAWSDHVNVHGQRFFFNRARCMSSRTDPRSAPRHALALQRQALKVLAEWAQADQVQALPQSFNEQLALADAKMGAPNLDTSSPPLQEQSPRIRGITQDYHLLAETIGGDSPRANPEPTAPPKQAFAWYS